MVGHTIGTPGSFKRQRDGDQEPLLWFLREGTGVARDVGLGLTHLHNSSPLWDTGTVPVPGVIGAGG